MLLKLKLFGTFSSTLNGRDLTFRTNKIRALFAYLALETAGNDANQKALARDRLATLLWGESDDKTAKQNLRISLYRLRSAIDKTAGEKLSQQLFEANKQTVRIQPTALEQLRCDAVQFSQLIQESQTHSHEDIHYCAECLTRLTKAADLYQGDLLEGILLDDAPAYEEWLWLTRERFLQQAQLVLDIIIESYQIQGRYELVREYGQRLLMLEPWRESTHRHIMRALALSGQRAAALTQYEKCKAVLWEELGAGPGAETAALAAQIEAGEPLETTADVTRIVSTTAPQTQPPHNLPAQMTPCFGREPAIKRIVKVIDNPSRRLITLLGEGGIGKSRLALEIGRRLKEGFRNGVWFIPLAMLPAADEGQQKEGEAEDQIATLVAETLSLSLTGKEAPRDQLISQLKSRNLLLIFDNFEHVLAGADLLIRLLEAGPEVTILATSREPLGYLAESIVRVKPLPLPKAEQTSPDLGNPAVALFVDRAERITDEFDVDDAEQMGQVVALCRLLGGLPLALELAAAGLRLQNLDELHGSIQRSFDAVTARMRDLPKRHRSMRAVFESSWERLTGREQEIFAKCAVFRGGFWAEAGNAVTGSSLGLLERLRDKSLFQQGENGRYGQHELLRQFAAEKLTAFEADKARQAHSRYFLNFVAERYQPLNGPRPQEPAAEITNDLDNIRLGWQTAVAHHDHETVLPAIEPLSTFYEMRGYYREAAERFGKGATLLKTEEAKSVRVQLYLKTHHIRALVRLHKYEQAITQAEHLLALPQTHTFPLIDGFVNLSYAEALWRQGKYQQAEPKLKHIFEISEKAGLSALTASAHYHLGTVYHFMGKEDSSVSHLSESVVYWRRVSSYRRLAQALNNLGVVFFMGKDYAQASKYLGEALTINEEIVDAQARVNILNNLSLISSEQGDYKKSRTYLWAILEDAEKSGAEGVAARMYLNLGWSYIREENSELAINYLEKSLEIVRRLQNPLEEAKLMIYLGDAYLLEQQYDFALQYYSSARQMNQSLDAEDLRSMLHKSTSRLADKLAEEGNHNAIVTVGEFQ